MINELFEKARRKLRDVRLNEVSLVKSPAAPDAKISLWKAKEADEPMTTMTKDAADAVRAIVAEELGKALAGDAVAKAIGESLTSAVAELKKTQDAPIRKAVDEINERAEALRKSGDYKLSPSQAMAAVIKAAPELYAQHRAETAMRRRDPRYY